VICDYIYVQENGERDNGISQGTPFEDLPDDWICPVCGVDKIQFKEFE